jgi:hypothetical protein
MLFWGYVVLNECGAHPVMAMMMTQAVSGRGWTKGYVAKVFVELENAVAAIALSTGAALNFMPC